MEKELKMFYIRDFKIDNIIRNKSKFIEFGKYEYSFTITMNNKYICHSTTCNSVRELKQNLNKTLKNFEIE